MEPINRINWEIDSLLNGRAQLSEAEIGLYKGELSITRINEAIDALRNGRAIADLSDTEKAIYHRFVIQRGVLLDRQGARKSR